MAIRTDRWSPELIAVTGILAGFALAGTVLIRIPIPGGGYVNVGDTFVILAGLWVGPTAGLTVGAIGAGLADLFAHPEFILATVVTKGFAGLVVGLIAAEGDRNISYTRQAVAALTGGLVIVVGYFMFGAFAYPWLSEYISFFAVYGPEIAFAQIATNASQSILNVFFGFMIWKIGFSVSTGEEKKSST